MGLSVMEINLIAVIMMIIIIIIIIIIIMSLFYEDNIFSTTTNLTYGPRLKTNNHNTIFTVYT